MNYFKLLNLKKEPFSNSPDPDLFFQSNQHLGCLQKLEMAIRLKQGLSVVIGDIGTGKSTLSRQLMRQLDTKDSPIVIHLLLDPEFTSPLEFLRTIQKTFGIPEDRTASEWQIKEEIKNYLFQVGVQQDKIPALIIDEGQKLPDFCVEILREFLNYETNQHKLLQIVIFAQKEFQITLNSKANFADRITTLQELAPLSFKDTCRMIIFRVNQCRSETANPHYFSQLALVSIYILTGGYPRKIVMLCSKVLIGMLIHNERKVGILRVLNSAKETSWLDARLKSLLLTTFIAFGLLLIGAISFISEKNPPASIAPSTKHQAEKLSQPPKQLLTETTEQTKILPPPPPLETGKPSTTGTKPDQAKPPPTILGSLPMQKHTTLSKMVARVYGRYTIKRLKEVLAKNPHIVDPNHITDRTVISFPNLTERMSRRDLSVVLFESSDFSETYDFIKKYSDQIPSSQIVAGNNGTNRDFFVVLEEVYPDQSHAEEALQALPSFIQNKASIIDLSGQNMKHSAVK